MNSCNNTLSRRLIASIGVNGQPSPLFVVAGIAAVATSDFALRSDHCCEAPVSTPSRFCGPHQASYLQALTPTPLIEPRTKCDLGRVERVVFSGLRAPGDCKIAAHRLARSDYRFGEIRYDISAGCSRSALEYEIELPDAYSQVSAKVPSFRRMTRSRSQ